MTQREFTYGPGTEPRARRDDPQTSQDAAASMAETHGEHHAAILETLAGMTDGTPEEISERMEGALGKVEVCKRFRELERLTMITKALDVRGLPVLRENRSGRKARAFRVVDGR